jgi:hypothetical protein
MDYSEIVAGELQLHDIKLCAGCATYHSHTRGFAVASTRTIHMNAKFARRSTLYGFLHEVGHIVSGHGPNSKLRRYQQEQEAEDYARQSMRAYGIAVPRCEVQKGDAYVARFKRMGDNVKAALAAVVREAI